MPAPAPIPVLDTERLRLRAWAPSDQAAYAAMNADPRVMEHLPALLSRAESDAQIAAIEAHFARHGFGWWAVERRTDGTLLGTCGLRIARFEAAFTPCVEIGWRLAFAAWGQGYATEAARAARAYGFETLGLTEIVSFTVPHNTRSRTVMERLGMRHDPAEDFDHPALPPGHALRRHVLYRLRRSP